MNSNLPIWKKYCQILSFKFNKYFQIWKKKFENGVDHLLINDKLYA